MMNQSTASKEPLTEEQKKLAAQNHNLIYYYAQKNNLLISEYYDILAIGLCKAARSYDKEKAAFSTYAYWCMRNEVYAYWEGIQKKSAVPEDLTVSYDSLVQHGDSDGQTSFLEFIKDSRTCDDMMYNAMRSEFAKMLTKREREIFLFLADGFTQKDVAHELGVTRQSVHYHIRQIRNKLIEYLG